MYWTSRKAQRTYFILVILHSKDCKQAVHWPSLNTWQLKHLQTGIAQYKIPLSIPMPLVNEHIVMQWNNLVVHSDGGHEHSILGFYPLDLLIPGDGWLCRADSERKEGRGVHLASLSFGMSC